MVYELRTYWAAPGKLEALHHRFRTLTLGLFARHGLRVVGFWTPQPITEESGDLVYILAAPSEDALAAGWAALRADPAWVQGKAKSEVGGVLAARVVSRLLVPTDYSPLQ